MCQPPRQVLYYHSHRIAVAAFDSKIVFFKYEVDKKGNFQLRMLREYPFEGDFKSRNNADNKIVFRIGKHSIGILIVKKTEI